MWIINIIITNFVLDSEMHHKTIGPFESEDAANTYIKNNKEKIMEDLKSSEDYSDDDDWIYEVRKVLSP